jgi:hypothetical protein
MTTSSALPVAVTDEARYRIAKLGLHAEVQRIIEHAQETVSDLEHIDVVLYDRYDLGDEPGLAIDVYSRRPYDRLADDERKLARWMVSEFPPTVLQHLILDYHPGSRDAGLEIA